MDGPDLGAARLAQQGLVAPRFAGAADLVAWMGAVQGQDYLMALWGLGQRLAGATEAALEAAVADYRIVRIGFMRGTLHFLPGRDFRWMVALLGPQMRRAIAAANRIHHLGLDEATLARSNAVIVAALRGRRLLTRPALSDVLARAGIPQDGLARTLTSRRAQADGLICFGPRQGKQHTFALVDEWVPEGPDLDGAAALAEFTRRYFLSHGPATLTDFAWWSGFTAGEAAAALDAVRGALVAEEIAGQTYWRAPDPVRVTGPAPQAWLLPNYDEYLVAYRDRSAVLARVQRHGVALSNEAIFSPTIVMDGQVVGTWKRRMQRAAVAVSLDVLVPLTVAEQAALDAAVARFGAFLGLPVTVSGREA